MAKNEKESMAKGNMNSPVGMCSYKKNPMKKAAQVASECGPGTNPDQQKANRLLQKAKREKESLRGEMGM